jgi:tRNA pseudouridine38-40 synthase
VAHADIARETDGDTICSALNFHVRPHKVVVLKAEAVDKTFHARFGALSRAYRYRIVNRRAPLALLVDRAWQVYKPLDIPAMQEAANLLIGQHDFSTFRAQFCQSKSPVRTLEKLDLARDDEEIHIHTEARSFLYHQVRNMVGTLALVGSGQWSLGDFKTAFEARDRSKGGPTAPAHGLCFWNVTYPALHNKS